MAGQDSNTKDSKWKLIVVVLAIATVGALGLVAKRLWTMTGEPEGQSGSGSQAASKPNTEDKLDTIINAAADYGQKQEWGKAEAILKEAANQYPDVQRVRLAYAECLIKQKKLPEAFSEFEKAAALGDLDSKTRIMMGTIANMLGKLDRAEEQYSMVMVKDKTNPDAPLFLGQVLLKQNKLDEAKANLLIAGRLTPQRSVIWGTLAEISLRENKLDLAEQHLKKARELEPQIVEWNVLQARLFNRRQQPEKALDALAGVEEARKTSPAIARILAESYGMLGKKIEASATLRAASDAVPTDADLALEAALAAERAGDKALGLMMAERAEKLGNAQAEAVKKRLQ